MCLNLRQPAMIAALLLSSIAPVARAAADVPPAATAPTAPTVRAPAPPATAAAPPARPAEAPAQVPAFGFANVRQLAQQRAAHEYHPVSDALPASIANLSYDQYRDIRFRPASALWRGEALFEVQFFHRGYSNKEHINIFEVGPAGVTPVAYDPRFFTFGRLLKIPRAPASLGYAGFRVHYPLQTPHYKDELVAFLGASYFRVLARNQYYGASARGLAIDTAEPGGEEFPTFTDFWLVRPQPNDRTLTVYALLDSKSVAGAYQFEIRPGETTQVEVHCELFARRAIAKLGVAPLTSMFLYGVAEGGRRFDDYRPQVHDSDGLMAETGHGQWLWRPLGNPRELRVNRFVDESPHGFGLVQRDRAFADYQDVESHYESRPSYWVQPLGAGARAASSWWRSRATRRFTTTSSPTGCRRRASPPGKPLTFAYLLSAFGESHSWPPGRTGGRDPQRHPGDGRQPWSFRSRGAPHADRFRRRRPRWPACRPTAQGTAERRQRRGPRADRRAPAGHRRLAGDLRRGAEARSDRSICTVSLRSTERCSRKPGSTNGRADRAVAHGASGPLARARAPHAVFRSHAADGARRERTDARRAAGQRAHRHRASRPAAVLRAVHLDRRRAVDRDRRLCRAARRARSRRHRRARGCRARAARRAPRSSCRSTTRIRGAWRRGWKRSGPRSPRSPSRPPSTCSSSPTPATPTSLPPRRRCGSAFVSAHDAAGRVFYRRRLDRSGRKAGNIADFVRRWGAQLRVHAGAGCRQRHERHGAGDARAADGGAPRDRHPAVTAAAGRARDAVCAPRSSSARACRVRCSRADWPSGSSARATTGATTPSSACAPFARALRAAAAVRAAAARRGDPQPRLRRGRVHAPRRLRGAPGAGAGGQLGGGAGERHRLRRARPALDAGQSAAHAPAGLPRAAPAEPHSYADGHRLLREFAHVAGAAAHQFAAERDRGGPPGAVLPARDCAPCRTGRSFAAAKSPRCWS